MKNVSDPIRKKELAKLTKSELVDRVITVENGNNLLQSFVDSCAEMQLAFRLWRISYLNNRSN